MIRDIKYAAPPRQAHLKLGNNGPLPRGGVGGQDGGARSRLREYRQNETGPAHVICSTLAGGKNPQTRVQFFSSGSIAAQRRRRCFDIEPALGRGDVSVGKRRGKLDDNRGKMVHDGCLERRAEGAVSGGQFHLIHLTILRRFSWPSLAYLCTKVA